MANDPEHERVELEKKIDEKISQIMEYDGLLRSLLSNGVQLGSFYLVFQGVILTAIASSNNVFRCLSYWLLIALSSLASFPNLVAMYNIGGEYIRLSFQRERYLRYSDVLVARLARLSEPNPASSTPGTPPVLSAPTSPVDATAPPARSNIPTSCVRYFLVAFFIAFYLGVSAIMYLVCIKTLRKPGAQCKQH